MARRRKSQLELPAVLPEEVAGDAQVAGPPPVEVVQSEAPTVQRWRVAREAIVSLFGHMTTMQAGKIVSAAEYGPDGLKRIADQVELVPVA